MSCLSLPKLYKSRAAVLLTFVSFLAYCARPSLLQSGDIVDSMDNITCPNKTCAELPASCLICDFNESCAYGTPVEATCWPVDDNSPVSDVCLFNV